MSNPGPTPNAPETGDNFQVPSTPTGTTSFTSLKDQNPPPATSISNSKEFPSSDNAAMYVIESAASAGLPISAPLITLANPKKAPVPSKVMVPAVASYV